jgi:hypothetical protein
MRQSRLQCGFAIVAGSRELQRRATLVRPAILVPLSSGARTLAQGMFRGSLRCRACFGNRSRRTIRT